MQTSRGIYEKSKRRKRFLSATSSKLSPRFFRASRDCHQITDFRLKFFQKFGCDLANNKLDLFPYFIDDREAAITIDLPSYNKSLLELLCYIGFFVEYTGASIASKFWAVRIFWLLTEIDPESGLKIPFSLTRPPKCTNSTAHFGRTLGALWAHFE